MWPASKKAMRPSRRADSARRRSRRSRCDAESTVRHRLARFRRRSRRSGCTLPEHRRDPGGDASSPSSTLHLRAFSNLEPSSYAMPLGDGHGPICAHSISSRCQKGWGRPVRRLRTEDRYASRDRGQCWDEPPLFAPLSLALCRRRPRSPVPRGARPCISTSRRRRGPCPAVAGQGGSDHFGRPRGSAGAQRRTSHTDCTSGRTRWRGSWGSGCWGRAGRPTTHCRRRSRRRDRSMTSKGRRNL